MKKRMNLTLLYADGCPSWQLADERQRTLAAEYGFEITYRKADTPSAAKEQAFRGSPTILVDGQDMFADGNEPVGLSCHIYQTPDGPAGSPTLAEPREMVAGQEADSDQQGDSTRSETAAVPVSGPPLRSPPVQCWRAAGTGINVRAEDSPASHGRTRPPGGTER